MNIHLDIQQIVLHDVHLTAHERVQFDAAVQRELGRLIGARGLSETLSSTAIPALRADDVTWTGNPHHLGAQVAHAIYTQIGGNHETR